MRRMVGAGLAVLLTLAVGCSGGNDGEAAGGQATGNGGGRMAPGAPTEATALYTTQVLPILKANCYRCHGGMNHRGGLNVQTQAGMMRGGKSGVDVIAGDPEHSKLLTSMRHEGTSEKPMPPPPRSKLSDADIAVVARWIKEGALMPADVEKP